MNHIFEQTERALRNVSFNSLDEADVGYAKLAEAKQILSQLPQLTDLEQAKVTRPDLMRFFVFEHLPEHLREPSKAVAELASAVGWIFPEHRKLTDLVLSALRLILEAKDCFVRALL